MDTYEILMNPQEHPKFAVKCAVISVLNEGDKYVDFISLVISGFLRSVINDKSNEYLTDIVEAVKKSDVDERTMH